MERLTTLLDKIRELNSKSDTTLIEVDLMMDYTKVLYADLLEYRNKLAFNEAITLPDKAAQKQPEIILNPLPEPAAAVKPEIIVPEVAPSVSLPQQHYSNADIREYIGINDKYLFISELFGNNKDAYDEVISEINTFDTEEEAISWLNNTVYQQYQWKDDMEALQSFYKSLNDFFVGR